MKTKKIRIRQGFTIVELVIVIGVIGVLSAVLIPTFVNLNNKANQAADESLIKNLNTQLRMKEVEEGKNKNMSEALADALEAGYKVENLTPKSGKDIVWDQEKDEFAQRETVPTDGSAYKFWTIAKSEADLTKGYSPYLYFQPTGDLTVNTGFDVGEYTGFNISYVRDANPATDPGRKVVIRTNSPATTVTVNAPADSVTHYGEAGALNIIAVKTSSYHENGKIGFAEIKTGRIVLEPKSEVGHIHINSNGSNAFDPVIIQDNGTENLPDSITRDEVDVASATLVVTVETVGGTQEEVYVYSSGSAGTTEKTSTQNTDVNSTLGGLVLDNGTTSKALNEEAKEEVKDETASEAVSSDFEKQEGNDRFVARIGQTGYEQLSAALAVANDSVTPLKVAILKDIQQSGSLTISNSVTIKGGDHTLTTVGTATKGNMAAFDICDTSSNYPLEVAVQDLTINSTKHSRVFLLNGDYSTYQNPNVLDASNLDITTDGEAFYSNGPSAINVRNCDIKHEGQYVSGKDAVYYSALIVGYNGLLNVYDSKVSSFGNGAATFPSGGTVNLYNTEIKAFDDFVDASAGYVFWARHEKSYDTGAYAEWCGSAIINVYSGAYSGPYKLTDDGHTSLNRDAEINLFGGTYGQDPSDYVAEGRHASQNADGTWTVK